MTSSLVRSLRFRSWLWKRRRTGRGRAAGSPQSGGPVVSKHNTPQCSRQIRNREVQLKPKQFSGLIIRAFIHQAESDRALPTEQSPVRPNRRGSRPRKVRRRRLGWSDVPGPAAATGNKGRNSPGARVFCVRRGRAPAGRGRSIGTAIQDRPPECELFGFRATPLWKPQEQRLLGGSVPGF